MGQKIKKIFKQAKELTEDDKLSAVDLYTKAIAITEERSDKIDKESYYIYAHYSIFNIYEDIETYKEKGNRICL